MLLLPLLLLLVALVVLLHMESPARLEPEPGCRLAAIAAKVGAAGGSMLLPLPLLLVLLLHVHEAAPGVCPPWLSRPSPPQPHLPPLLPLLLLALPHILRHCCLRDSIGPSLLPSPAALLAWCCCVSRNTRGICSCLLFLWFLQKKMWCSCCAALPDFGDL